MMGVEFYHVIAAILIAVGLGSALGRRNIIAVLMGICTSGAGVLLAMAAIDRESARDTDGTIFAVCFGAILLVWVALGGVLAYRRFIAAGQVNIDEGNELRH